MMPRTRARTFVLATSALVLVAGCRSVPGAIPGGAKYVGGGYHIRFIAPVDGIVFAYDRGMKAVTGSVSVAQGESLSVRDGVMIEAMRPSVGGLDLYFLPISEVAQPQASHEAPATAPENASG